MTSIYTLTIFTSAFLLFLIQPLISKLLLPNLGGSPAVWNTSMMFFQILLLAGYSYAHLTARWLGAKKQFMLHTAVLLAALAWLPIAAKTDLGFESVQHPVRWMLTSLFLSVGFPFFALAANAPILQYWLSQTNHKDASNPYFLYSASNIGSLLALVCYPFAIEPLLTLQSQSFVWSLVFCAFAAMILACGISMRKHYVLHTEAPIQQAAGMSPSWRKRFYWIALAFCPSSLMLGVTTFITTDIGSVPLLWIIPLGLYLITFIIAFSKKNALSERAPKAIVMLAPLVVMALAFDFNFISQVMLLHLFIFFYISLCCHSTLANDKPDARYLTDFFLWVSFGGMLGGVFNSLVAPMIFSSPIEYPLVLILSLLLRPPEGIYSREKRELRMDFIIPVLFAVLLYTGFKGYDLLSQDYGDILANANKWLLSLLPEDYRAASGLSIGTLMVVALFLLFITGTTRSSHRPLRHALMLASLLAVTWITNATPSKGILKNTIYSERNFFGVNRVLESKQLNARMIIHGTTLHGIQSMDEKMRLTPLSYYNAIEDVFSHTGAVAAESPVAVLGLGTGSVACFGKKGQVFDFYEIDPVVASIASNTQYFTFLHDCPAKSNIIMGDGRLALANAQNSRYGIIVIDVFSSDAIPTHLLTQQALLMYKDKLTEDGILLFNISNRHLNLSRVMASLAPNVGMKAYIKRNMKKPSELHMPSVWVAMSRDSKHLDLFSASDKQWKPLEADPDTAPWTDDYSNILHVLL